MERISLIATKSLKYGGRQLRAGDPFDAPRMHAKAFVGTKKARYATEIPADAVQTSPVVENPPAVAGYDVAEAQAVPPASEPAQPVTRRNYRRKDVTAKS
jgi:hypothetical protein